MIVQPYGIQVWGDLLGLLTLFGIYNILKACRFPDAAKKWFWMVALGYSGWGSLTILPRALYRMDPTTFCYHLFYVVLAVWFIAKVRHHTWACTLSRMDAWEARVGVRLGDWVFDHVTHRGQAGDHERL